MNNVEPQFPAETVSESASILSRAVDADDDFSMLKCDYIGRAWLVQIATMQRRHSSVRDEQN